MIAQQCVGHHAFAPAEVLAGIAGLDCRAMILEFLAVNGTVEGVQIERIVRENWKLGYPVAD